MSKASDNEEFALFWQTHLRGTGHYLGNLDKWAGPMTKSASRAFAGLDPQPAPPISVPDTDLSGLPKPAETYRLPAETTAAMTAFYGQPSKSPDYLDYFSFPHLQTRLYTRTGELLKDRAGDLRQDHSCHRLLVGRLTAALAEIYVTLGKEQFEREGWHLYGGCHNYRSKTGGGSLSTHSWGIAVDMNPNENPYAATKTTFSGVAIGIMEKWGFLSGGRAWGLDWMHFQAVTPNISAGSYYAKNGLPKNIVRA